MDAEERAIRALIAAGLVSDPPRRVSACPVCGRQTREAVTTGPALCEPCTVRDLGHSRLHNSLRIEARLSWKAFDAKLEKYGPPWVNPKAWTTPKSRRK